MTEGFLKANLEQVGCIGGDTGCTHWNGRIEFDVVPHGLQPPTPFNLLDLQVATPNTIVPPGPGDLYLGPGGFHDPAYEAILNFRISVWGEGPDGPVLGAAEARIVHTATNDPTGQHTASNYCVSVPLALPAVPLPPTPAGLNRAQQRQAAPPSLWFNFSVGNVC